MECWYDIIWERRTLYIRFSFPFYWGNITSKAKVQGIIGWEGCMLLARSISCEQACMFAWRDGYFVNYIRRPRIN